ncbi:MAG: protein phosphatase 2C domain-containing protein [Syntrophobacteraceae bacterium]|nr:protein phosphatase 2C domain-containing protein [Syntrophobacteraceae bacterium]
MQIESITHVGLHRKNNEDRFFVNVLDNERTLLIIADGMGGHAAGEIAAELAVSSFKNYRPRRAADICAELLDRMTSAREAVVERSLAVPAYQGMGTTLSALMLVGRSAFWAHVGDTRIYRYHEGELITITDDHTVAGKLLRDGKINREQARVHPYSNVLTRCIGCQNHDPDSGLFQVAVGDCVLLSSDGLHDLIPESRIAAILSEGVPPGEKLAALLNACLEAGGRDNITAVIAAI